MMERNILQVIDYAAPYRGNFIPSMETLVEHWKPYGRMIFLVPDVAKAIPWMVEFQRKHMVYFISRKFFSKKISFSLLMYLRKIIREENIEVIHTHFIVGNGNIYLLSNLIAPRIRYIAMLHNHYIVSGRLGFLRNFFFYHTYDMVLGVSESVTCSVSKKAPNKLNTATVRNAIDFKRLSFVPERRKFEDGYKYSIMVLGFPFFRKGIDIAIAAVEKLNRKGNLFSLWIVTSGSPEEYLLQLKENLGKIPESVHVLSSIEEIATYYNSADVFLSSSREEGFCYALVEAAFCTPYVITSNIPAPVSLNIPHMGIYNVDSVDDLCKELINYGELIENNLKTYKIQQRDYVLKEFDIDKWAEKMITYY